MTKSLYEHSSTKSYLLADYECFVLQFCCCCAAFVVVVVVVVVDERVCVEAAGADTNTTMGSDSSDSRIRDTV